MIVVDEGCCGISRMYGKLMGTIIFSSIIVVNVIVIFIVM